MNQNTTIFGSSDDLLDFNGRIYDEFGCYMVKNGKLTCSDGSVFNVSYNGVWSIEPVEKGPAFIAHTPNQGADSDSYSDQVEMGPIDWVKFEAKGRVNRAYAKGVKNPLEVLERLIEGADDSSEAAEAILSHIEANYTAL